MIDRALVPNDASSSRGHWLVHTELSRSYEIRFVEGLASGDAGELANYLAGRRALIVSTPTVADLYGRAITQSLRDHEVNARLLVVKGGEQSKSIETALHICRAAQGECLDRQGVMIALGGGVCTDLATLAAALFRRGITCLRIPTTLIGQLDASIGIKGAVNFGGKKNSLGCYCPPSLVLVDSAFLQSLPSQQIRHGLAEVIKMAIIRDPFLLDLVERHSERLIATSFQQPQAPGRAILEHAIGGMLQELSPNIYEDRTYRRLVDFGHTFSPLLEAASNFRLPHGEAVAIDMMLSCEIARELGLLDRPTCDRIRKVIMDCRLPVTSPDLSLELAQSALVDAERHRGGDMNLVVPTRVGAASFLINRDELSADVLRTALSRLPSRSCMPLASKGHGRPCLVFDVGGTNLRVGLYDPQAGLLTSRRTASPNLFRDAADGPGAIRRSLVRHMNAAAQEVLGHAAPQAVSVAFAGPLNEAGAVTAAPTIWGRHEGGPIDLQGALEELWPDARISLLNDVTAAGYRYLRHARDSLCIVTVGSGIGNKIFADGRPWTGPNHRGGEIGHWRVDFSASANRCDCGGRGHLGAIASGRGMLATARQWIAQDPGAFRRSALSDITDNCPQELDNQRIVRAFHDGDPWTRKLIEYGASVLASSLAAVHTAIGVERFVIYGGFAMALGDKYRQNIVAAASDACWDFGQNWSAMIELGHDDDDSGLIGAGRYAVEFAPSAPVLSLPDVSPLKRRNIPR